jgi:hypothetical protein
VGLTDGGVAGGVLDSKDGRICARCQASSLLLFSSWMFEKKGEARQDG